MLAVARKNRFSKCHGVYIKLLFGLFSGHLLNDYITCSPTLKSPYNSLQPNFTNFRDLQSCTYYLILSLFFRPRKLHLLLESKVSFIISLTKYCTFVKGVLIAFSTFPSFRGSCLPHSHNFSSPVIKLVRLVV